MAEYSILSRFTRQHSLINPNRVVQCDCGLVRGLLQASEYRVDEGGQGGALGEDEDEAEEEREEEDWQEPPLLPDAEEEPEVAEEGEFGHIGKKKHEGYTRV